jgi:catechol 2,3-dioxygenase-like lactoylglutathione lyase family enzyme
MISGVNHITLSVRDVDRSFGFYVETLVDQHVDLDRLGK